MTVERNAACPCGSGRKYKKCCLAAEASAQSAHALALAPLRAVMAVLTDEFTRTFPIKAVAAAQAAFCGLDESLEPVADDETYLVSFYLYFDHVPEPGSVPGWVDGETLADRYLRTRGDRLSPRERAMLVSVRESLPSFYGVTDVRPRLGVRVTDIIRGGELDVIDPDLAQDVTRGDILFLRLVPDGSDFRVASAGNVAFPPGEFPSVRAFRDDYVRQRTDGTWSDEVLRANSSQVRFRYLELVSEASDPEDWDDDFDSPDVVELTFEVPSAARAHAALKHLANDLAPEEMELNVERDADGAIVTASWPWREAHVDSDGSRRFDVLAGFFVSGTSLVVDGLDAAQADRVRALVAEALPDAREQHPDGEEFLDDDGNVDPKLVAAFGPEIAAHFWEAWPAKPTPTLDGLSPLQALEVPGGRERVAAYLTLTEDVLPHAGLPRLDTADLRRRLGLPPRADEPSG